MKKKKPKQKHIHHNKRKPDRRSTKKTQNEYECKIKNRFLTRQEFHSKRGRDGGDLETRREFRMVKRSELLKVGEFSGNAVI